MIPQDYKKLKSTGFLCNICKNQDPSMEYGTSRYHNGSIICATCFANSLKEENTSLNQFIFSAEHEEGSFVTMFVRSASSPAGPPLTKHYMNVEGEDGNDIWDSFRIRHILYDLNYFVNPETKVATISVYRLTTNGATIQEGGHTININNNKGGFDSWVLSTLTPFANKEEAK